MNEELKQKLLELAKREISLSDVCDVLKVSKLEAFAIIKVLRDEGINIVTKDRDNDIYLFNNGEREFKDGSVYKFKTNKNREFKFAVISDTRIGSKSQQLSILNDIYAKAYQAGYNNVIHCGNITEGLYPVTSKYDETTFLKDTLKQVDYIVKNYPYIEGMNTYFLTGKKDESHLRKNKLNIGKRISFARPDMIYLGDISCLIDIDNVRMMVLNSRLSKTYTKSYRPQQQIKSYRSEDKPDILLYGGLMDAQKLTRRDVHCLTIPSVTATTEEMNDKRYSNTVGVWYVTVKTNDKGELDKFDAYISPYYVTGKDDYIKPKMLSKTLKKGGK